VDWPEHTTTQKFVEIIAAELRNSREIILRERDHDG
jgi:hypothetical protein